MRSPYPSFPVKNFPKNNNSLAFGYWSSGIFCVLYCFFSMGTQVADKMLCHSLWFLWFFTALFFCNNVFSKAFRNHKYIPLYIFMIYYFLSSMFSVGIATSANRIISLMELFSPILMYDIYKNSGKNVIYFLVLSLLAITLYNVKSLFEAIDLYGLGLRIIQEDSDFFLHNAFNWSYSWVMITTFCAVVLFSIYSSYLKEKKLVLVISITILILGIIVVFRSLFMTAIVSLLFGLLLAIMYGRRKWIAKSIIMSVVMGVFFVVIFNTLLNWIGTFQDDMSFFDEKFGEIYAFLTGKTGGSSDMAYRNQLSSISIKTFLSNPLFGINHKITDYRLVQYSAIGDHSEWMDAMALYGMFSFVLFYFIIKCIKGYPKELMPVFLIYIFVGFFNPLLYVLQNTITFLFIPLSLLAMRQLCLTKK